MQGDGLGSCIKELLVEWGWGMGLDCLFDIDIGICLGVLGVCIKYLDSLFFVMEFGWLNLYGYGVHYDT
jgi:hypothetical protein